MSGPMAGPNQGFQDRLNRVAEIRAPYEAAKPEVSVLPDWKKDVAAKSGFLIAPLIGVLAVLLVRIGAFHTTGVAMVSDTPDATLAIEVGGAALISAAILLLTRYKWMTTMPVALAGIAVMAVFMHNSVHSMPSLYSLAFSTNWTEQVIEATEPKSVYFRGEVIPLSAPDEKKAPTIRRLG